KAIAIQKGAKLHPRTKQPQLSETIVELLQLALEDSNSQEGQSFPEKTSDLEQLKSWITATQNQQSQHLNQKLNSVLDAQQQTQTELNRLYSLYHQLCDRADGSNRFSLQDPKEKTWYSPESPQQVRPLETYSAGPWMVNRQWLSLNGCFNEEVFSQWNHGEVRQDRQGNFWRRVDLIETDNTFKIPSSLGDSQTFYVLAD
ncbi:MAG: hypothetical protein SWJ54_04700, partial [Cyanobacteriota bacterium]|nr:hypothetical protein [Cyanobacteriota bacterium]